MFQPDHFELDYNMGIDQRCTKPWPFWSFDLTARMFNRVSPFRLARSMVYFSTAMPRFSVGFTNLQKSVPCLWRLSLHKHSLEFAQRCKMTLTQFVEFSAQLLSFWYPSLQISGTSVAQNSNLCSFSGRLLFCV